MAHRLLVTLACIGLLACSSQQAPGTLQVRIPTGAGGVGFLPLLVMQKHQLLERYGKEAGLTGVTVNWIDLGGPSAMNDALLSGSVDFIAAGPPAFLTLWDATHDSAQVKGVAAMASLPMYLNVRDPRLTKLDDLRQGDKIGVTAIKVSIPALIMQMYAAEHYGAAQAAKFDKFTVPMTHPDGVIAMLSGSGAGSSSLISAHFTSPPFHQIERRNPAIRTILKTDDVTHGPATFTMISTTKRFADANPKLITAFIQALGEASRLIAADKPAAADLLMGGKSNAKQDGASITKDDMIAVLNDPDIRFTQTPESVMKYATFMHQLGSIKNQPTSWKDLFLEPVHNLPGN
jgi:NitT/TauT family transport system substrate-binding protein